MTIPEVVRNNLSVSISSLLFGSILGWIISKLQSRTKRLRYSTSVERVALSAADAIFGNVSVTWSGNAVRNLYMARITLSNTSSHDFEKVPLRVYTGNDTFILTEQTRVRNSPDIVHYSPEYQAKLATAAGQTPTALQLETYYHTREYEIPIFNRDQVADFSYLCTLPNVDTPPGVFLSTQIKGAKLILDNRPLSSFGVPLHIALVHGMVICILTLLSSATFVHRVWAAGLICLVVGLFAQPIGAHEYKAERFLWKALTG